MVPLRGSNTKGYLFFGIPRDKLIKNAVVNFVYTYSPSMIEELSHIKVFLNQELTGVLPLEKKSAGHKVTKQIPLDQALFTDHNQLRLELIAHYKTETCENPLHTSLWADISGRSTIEFNVEQLPVVDELSYFPAPFYDLRTTRKLNLPFVFGPNPATKTVEAAGIISSWFGAEVGWRGARFPVSVNEAPLKHAIVIATNDDRPDFLATYPKVEEPTIATISLPKEGDSQTNKSNPDIKLLLVLGKDESQLTTAAQALVLGQAVLAGEQVTVKEVDLGPLRVPYDAPNWVRMDRPTKFGEMVNSPTELQAQGHTPKTIQFGLRIPADLFIWQSRGVPVDVKYRYTPLIDEGESRLNISINDQFVEAFNLRTSGKNGIKKQLDLPLPTDNLFAAGSDYYLPAFKMGSNNLMQFDFSFSRQVTDPCKSDPVDNVQAAIDPDSTVDFTGFPHYVALPNLGFFANSGFPFTIRADLSETLVVISDTPDRYELETFLTLMGRMGNSTGVPATRLELQGSSGFDGKTDKHILILGQQPHQKLISGWKTKLPMHISDTVNSIALPTSSASFLHDWFGFNTQPDTTPASSVTVQGKGELAGLIGFESPEKAERSVVSVVGVSNKDMLKVLDAFEDSGKISHIHGSIVQIRATSLESYLVGPTYTVGKLPLRIKVWYYLSKNPFVLMLLTVVSVILIAVLIWRTLHLVMSRRLDDTEA